MTTAISPGEWRYHPPEPAPLLHAHPVDAHQTLFVGGLGQRWLVDERRARAEPASMLAPEPLVGVLHRPGAAWVFVGQSGTTYEAGSPMGSLVASNPALERLARVESGSSAVLGIRRDGQLMRTEDAGLSWAPVGPAGARFSDLLLAPPLAVALQLPERLWWSSNEGRTWQALQEPAFGAERFTRDEEAGPVVVSALGVRRIGMATPPRLTALGRGLRPQQPALGRPPREGPSSRAMASGRAFSKNESYFEIELGVKAHSISGPIMGTLTRREAPHFSACNDIEVAGFERWVYAACTRERTGTTRQYEFFRSEDTGRSFEREEFVARADPEQLELAVGLGGELLATGLCPPEEALPGCAAQGIQRRREGTRDAGPGAELHAVPTPALRENALTLAFSADGSTAYAVGQRTKSDALFVFVSSDLGRGFTARPISLAAEVSTSGPVEGTLTPAEDGQVSLVLTEASGRQRLILLDAAGRTLSVNAPPVDTASVGAYASRALALSPEEAWESLNGGADWKSIGRVPGAICFASAARCGAPIRCQDAGCTIGDSLSRAGWRGQARPVVALLSPPPNGSSTTRRAVGPAWSCELTGPEWEELSGVARLPDASQAALGKTAWFALSTDDATAAAGLWLADEASHGAEAGPSVRYSELLAPIERPSEAAYYASLQVEGAAALRYPLPGAAGASQTRLTQIEVAWDNLLEQRRGRGIIADAGPHIPGDFAKSEGMARRARADLLSIASGGTYVRVHRHPEHDQISYFLDGSRVQEVPALRWSPPAPKGSHGEMARIEAQHVPLLFTERGATVLRARRRGAEWQFDAMSVGFADLESFALRQQRDIAYVQGRAGVHLTTRGPDGESNSHIFPLQAEGPVFGSPISVPTQADLKAQLAPCSSRQRTEAPRVVSPYSPGRRRPVLVRDAVEPLRVLLSDSAVLHGSPDAPCVRAFDAELVQLPGAMGASRERALVSLDGPSWLFRFAPDATRRAPRVEYRRMQCKPDAGVEVPPEVYEMPGARVEASSYGASSYRPSSAPGKK